MSRIIPDLVAADSPLPDEADVVVIGGGIVGVSTAYWLARRGVRVALCEKGLIGAEQSSRNWGWVRQMGRDVAELPLAMLSLRLWRGLNAELGEETGFRQTGISYLCRNEREMQQYRDWLDVARTHQIDTRMLDGAGAAALLPGMDARFLGGMHTASDGRAEPMMATSALARGAQKLGATLIQNCAVRGIETSAGAVSSVVSERGVIRTRQVVLAGGVWSRLFCGNLGIDLPLLKVLGSVARVSTAGPLPAGSLPEMPVGTSDFAFRRRLDGGYTVSLRNSSLAPIVPDSFRLFCDFSPQLLRSWRELKLRFGHHFFTEARLARSWPLDGQTVFERIRILDPEPMQRWVARGIARAASAFPALRGAKITQSWGGLIDTTPDAVPVIGPLNKLPGLFLATGFSGHGFGIGPGAGLLAAEMLTGAVPSVDPAPFRPGRFRRLAAG